MGATGNVNWSNAVTGFATTGIGMSLEKLTIKGYDKFWAEIAANLVADGAISFGLGKLPGKYGITRGKGNSYSIYKDALTGLRNGTATRITSTVVQKRISSGIVGGGYLDLYYGIKQFAYGKIKSICLRL